MNRRPSRIDVGTANWSDHTGFYPRGTNASSRLTYYASQLSMVEVNTSFYRRIKPSIYARWVGETPDHFGFVVKAHRAVCQPLRDRDLELQYFRSQRSAVDPLRLSGKFLGFLVQVGSHVAPNDQNMKYLARLRDGLGDDPIAIEFRHASWFEESRRAETALLLRTLEMAAVIPDEPRAGSIVAPAPLLDLTFPSFAYYRFMGRDSKGELASRERRILRASHIYSDSDLAELAQLVASRTLDKKRGDFL